MKKYLIDYQLPDEAPDHDVIRGKTEEHAVSNLKKKLIVDCDADGDQDILQWIEELQVLEIREV